MFTINLVTLACVDSAICCVDSAICCVDTVTRRGGADIDNMLHPSTAMQRYILFQLYVHCILIFTHTCIASVCTFTKVG